MNVKRIATVAFLIAVFALYGCEGSSGGSAKKGDGKIAWQKVDAGMHYASSNDKKLFMYVYTDWCSYCKKMENEVFSDDKISAYLNEHFTPVAINAESRARIRFGNDEMTEQEYAAMLGVQGYPTHVFMTANGEPITLAPGYIPAENFLKVLTYIAGDHYLHMSWDAFLSRERG
jgi:thioredoxin-related protein